MEALSTAADWAAGSWPGSKTRSPDSLHTAESSESCSQEQGSSTEQRRNWSVDFRSWRILMCHWWSSAEKMWNLITVTFCYAHTWTNSKVFNSQIKTTCFVLSVSILPAHTQISQSQRSVGSTLDVRFPLDSRQSRKSGMKMIREHLAHRNQQGTDNSSQTAEMRFARRIATKQPF